MWHYGHRIGDYTVLRQGVCILLKGIRGLTHGQDATQLASSSNAAQRLLESVIMNSNPIGFAGATAFADCLNPTLVKYEDCGCVLCPEWRQAPDVTGMNFSSDSNSLTAEFQTKEAARLQKHLVPGI